VAELERLLAEALARIAELEKQLAAARKDSSTSSKPPSSDIVKPPQPAVQATRGRKRKRRLGGRPGRPRHERAPFPPEEVDAVWTYEWPKSSLTPDWKPLDEFQTIQQVELVEELFEVTEHRARLYLHRPTGQVSAAPLPDEVVRAGLVGPRLSALVAYQKGACHMSYRVIETFLADVLHLPISTGQLAKIVGKASAALPASYEQVEGTLPGRAVVNVDETGHGRKRPASLGLGLPCARAARMYLVPRRHGEELGRAEGVPGRKLPRRCRLRLPQRVPQIPRRHPSDHAVLLGASDPGRKIPRDPAGRGDATFRRETVGHDQAPLSPLAPP
jgi:hypothetical protein